MLRLFFEEEEEGMRAHAHARTHTQAKSDLHPCQMKDGEVYFFRIFSLLVLHQQSWAQKENNTLLLATLLFRPKQNKQHNTRIVRVF